MGYHDLSADGPATPGLGLSRGPVNDLPRLQAEPTVEQPEPMLRGSGEEPAAGSSGETGGEAASELAHAASIRFPDLTQFGSNKGKVDALLDYIQQTAICRGELEHVRLHAHVNLRDALADYRRAPLAGSFKSKAASDDARRVQHPSLSQRVDGARWLIERCTEQINRLGGSDYDAASRAYTLLSGT